tara:strand:+ start:318 stop:506 length:189 start_codon:yes stop_codon:yes gene_type:complete
MTSNKGRNTNDSKMPKQRKTTLKWQKDGELTAIDMTRILDRLQNAELTTCDFSCDIEDKKII